MGNILGCSRQDRSEIVKVVVVRGDDKIAELGRRYPRGQVMEVSWWDDGGFGADDCFYLLQREVFAEIVVIGVGVHF